MPEKIDPTTLSTRKLYRLCVKEIYAYLKDRWLGSRTDLRGAVQSFMHNYRNNRPFLTRLANNFTTMVVICSFIIRLNNNLIVGLVDPFLTQREDTVYITKERDPLPDPFDHGEMPDDWFSDLSDEDSYYLSRKESSPTDETRFQPSDPDEDDTFLLPAAQAFFDAPDDFEPELRHNTIFMDIDQEGDYGLSEWKNLSEEEPVEAQAFVSEQMEISPDQGLWARLNVDDLKKSDLEITPRTENQGRYFKNEPPARRGLIKDTAGLDPGPAGITMYGESVAADAGLNHRTVFMEIDNEGDWGPSEWKEKGARTPGLQNDLLEDFSGPGDGIGPRAMVHLNMDELIDSDLYIVDQKISRARYYRSEKPPFPASAPSEKNFPQPISLAESVAADIEALADSVVDGGSLVIIDPSIADYQTLLKAVQSEATVAVINPVLDGLAQITEILHQISRQQKQISSLHILNHGAPGYLKVGTSEVDIQSLETRAEMFRQWRSALTADADLLIYACDLAAEDDGKSFLQKISGLSGADIAASVNPTGQSSLGGDWDLEYNLGTIQTSQVINPAALNDFRGLLLTDSGIQTFDANNSTYENVSAVAALTDGKIAIIYTVGSDIKFQFINADGSLGTSDIVASTGGTVHADALSGGGFVVVWHYGSSSNLKCWHRVYDNNGNPLTSATNVSTSAQGPQQSSKVAALSGGGYVVGFLEQYVEPNQAPYFRIFNASGTPVTGQIKASDLGGVNLDDLISNYSPSFHYIGALNDGGFVVAMTQGGTSSSPTGKYYLARFNASGTEQSWPATNSDRHSEYFQKASNQVISGSAKLRLDGLSNGGFVVVYELENGAVENRKWVRRFFDSSGNEGTETDIVTVGNTWGRFDLLGLSSGEFLYTHSRPSGNDYALRTTKYNNDGTVAVAETAVSSIQTKTPGFTGKPAAGNYTVPRNPSFGQGAFSDGGYAFGWGFKITEKQCDGTTYYYYCYTTNVTNLAKWRSFTTGTPNNNPTITIADSTLVYTENDPVTQIDPAATANDADGDADWDGGKLEVQITANNEPADEISVQAVGSITINTSNGQISHGGVQFGTADDADATVTNNTLLTINFNSNATNARVQDLVKAISYRNTSDNPGTSNRTVTFTVTDNKSGSNNDTRTIQVNAQNDPPTDISLDSTSVDENQPSGTTIGTFSTTDPDN